MTVPPTRTPPPYIQSRGPPTSLPGFANLAEHWHLTSTGSHLHYFTNAPGVGPSAGPVLTLLHGWPFTSFTWRHVIPALQTRIRLFIPDQPGIAYSTAASSGSKRVLGRAYLEAIVHAFGRGTQVVLGAQDRGARIAQRIAVDWSHGVGDGGWTRDNVEVLGALLIDIVPITAQFTSAGHSEKGAANAVKYFHWAFLPVTDLSVDMIMAYGGEKFCRAVMNRARGSDEKAREMMERDGAIDVYAAWFGTRESNEAAAEDYRAASAEDFDEMARDQAAGRKLEVPVRVLYCSNLEAMHDVREAWKGYVKEGTSLELHAVQPGYGHQIQEEAPEWTLTQFEALFEQLGI